MRDRSKLYVESWLFWALLVQVSYAKTSSLKIEVSDFHSRKSNLIDSTLPMYEIYSESEIKDSTFVENPRLKIVQNIWCWSERDNTPRCTTYLVLDDNKIAVTNIFRPKSSNENYEAFRERFDKVILTTLRENVDKINMVELLRYEETSRGWAIFEGAIYTEVAFAIAALVELLASNLSNRGYNWSYVGIPTGGFFLTYSAYRFIAMDPSPTLSIIKIKF
jgi:hypothetical protein